LKAQPPKTYQKRFENCNSLHFKPIKTKTTISPVMLLLKCCCSKYYIIVSLGFPLFFVC